MFHDTTAPVFDTLPLGSLDDFTAHATDYLVDDVIVSRISHAPQRLRRSIRHVRHGGEDALAALVYRQGRFDGRVSDADLILDADHAGIIDLGRPFHAVCTAVDAIWVVVPGIASLE